MGPQDEYLYKESPKFRKNVIDKISNTRKSIRKHLSNTRKLALGDKDILEKDGELKSNSKKSFTDTEKSMENHLLDVKKESQKPSHKNLILKFMSIKSDKKKTEEGTIQDTKSSKKGRRNKP